MKIYFAGAIRAGRNDARIYSDLIKHLKTHGEVLTEHIGDGGLTEIGEDGPNDEWIYERDMNWLRSADCVIAEVTKPSLGVGYELAVAEELGLKILCIYRYQAGKRLSAMLAGNKKITIQEYASLEDAFTIIGNFLKAETLS